MKKRIRMIGIDLDGTLLTVKKELTETSRDVLVQAIRAGIQVVPVTGRPLTGVPLEVLGIPGIRYVITSNGANTYALDLEKQAAGAGLTFGDLQKENPRQAFEAVRESGPGSSVWKAVRVLRREHLPHDVVRRILDASAGENVIREIFVRGIGYHDPRTQKMLEARFGVAPAILAYINRSRRIVPDFEDLLTDERSHVENVSLMFSSMEERDAAFARIRKIRADDGSRFLHVLLPWKTDLEVTHVLADKWLALQELGEQLGIDAEQILTLGDGDNDRAMLLGAGLSVAMGNAPDFVKKTAKLVTEDNEHDGAARAIRRVLEQAGVLPAGTKTGE